SAATAGWAATPSARRAPERSATVTTARREGAGAWSQRASDAGGSAERHVEAREAQPDRTKSQKASAGGLPNGLPFSRAGSGDGCLKVTPRASTVLGST